MKAVFALIRPGLVYFAATAVVYYGLHLNRQDGYDQGFKLATANGKRDVSALKESHALEKQLAAEAALNAANRFIADLRTEQEKSNRLASQLANTKDDLRRTTEKLTGEIVHVTTLYRRALDAKPEPLPVAVFTTGFVRVWNNANGITAPTPSMPAPRPSNGTDPSSSGAGSPDDLDSGLTTGQLLTNHVRNGELHGSCRAQLNRLIDWTLNGSN